MGLNDAEVDSRRKRFGANTLPAVSGPSAWSVAWRQIINPMTLMLIGVVVVSALADQRSTTVMVGLLVTLNVVRGTSQEIKAQESVDALAHLQVRAARVRRNGSIVEIDAAELVPGDIVSLEAGESAPADGRIITAATLEMQESALTGESAPVPKDADRCDDPETALGDRTDMVFQNTLATRGTATVVVTATGSLTEMGRIAGMVGTADAVRQVDRFRCGVRVVGGRTPCDPADRRHGVVVVAAVARRGAPRVPCAHSGRDRQGGPSSGESARRGRTPTDLKERSDRRIRC